MSIDHGTKPGLGKNLKYKDVPVEISTKSVNLYARGLLTEQVLDDIDAAPGETKSVTPAVQALFDAASGFVKHLRRSEKYRSKIRDELLQRIQYIRILINH